MNIGLSQVKLGQVEEALRYFQQSRDVYEEIGDEGRAAEGEVNAAGLQIHYGSDPADGLRRLAIARAALDKVGYTDFEVVAMQLEGVGLSFSGQQSKALRLFHEALSIATERHQEDQMVSLKLDIARC